MNKTTEELNYLKKRLGVKLVEIILGVPNRTINAWIKEEETPTDRQKFVIEAAKETVQILLDYVTVPHAKLWLVEHSDYLYGVPAIEIRRRPQEVVLAALNMVSRGEIIEVGVL